MQGNGPLGIAVGALGLLFLLAAAFNWDWFFGLRRVRILESLITRTGARIVYGLLGAFLAYVGLDVATNPRHNKAKKPPTQTSETVASKDKPTTRRPPAGREPASPKPRHRASTRATPRPRPPVRPTPPRPKPTLPKALADLRSPDRGKRWSAIQTLGGMKVDEARRDYPGYLAVRSRLYADAWSKVPR